MGDFIPITRTKIIVPRRRAELLKRQRLLSLLDELLDYRLIIVAAPAGYGKTSMLVDFAHSTQWPICWYSLDALDNDPQRFIAHFISAIALRFPEFGKTCLAALQSMDQDRLDLDVLASLVINDAYENITEHFALVLDDFHLVEGSQPVVAFVNRFLQDADENCHLILASRALLTLPDLPLMVARSQVGGLSFDELCFRPDEIQGLLTQTYQMTVTDQEAAELAKETEGWVTGLLLSTQLMGKTIANRQRVARVSGVGLYEYLAQQVLAQQSEEVQAFLMRSALLDEFDIKLCDEVIGRALNIQPPWRDLMDVVLRFNLFVLPVGEDGAFLRYHHLFQDFLRARIQRDRPDEARLILLRLAEVYMEREDWERAYAIYKSMGETDAIARLVEKAGSTMIAHGRMVTLSDWLDNLSPEWLPRYPALISLQGAVAFWRGDTAQGAQLMAESIEGLRAVGAKDMLAVALLRRSVAYRQMGRYQDAYQDAEDALALVPATDPPSVISADALCTKGLALYYQGQLNEALHLLDQSLAAYRALRDDSAAAKVLIEIGRAYKTLGNYAGAEEVYVLALTYYQATGNLLWQANLYNSLGVLQHARSDYIAATASLEKAIHYARLGVSPRLEAYALTSIGDLYQELDAFQEAFEAYRQAREITQRARDGYLLFYLNLAEARLKQALGESAQARELLQVAERQAEERGSRYELNLCKVEWGRMKLAEGQYAAALAHFSQSLGFFVEQGYQVEVPRARLYVFLSAYLSGNIQESRAQVILLNTLLQGSGQQGSDGQKLLVAAGREVESTLEKLRGDEVQRAFITELLDQVLRYELEIPGLRRTVRRHAVIVPFAPPKVTIRALGKVQVKVADHAITSSEWQVQTARDLFFLLVAHPEGLTKEQVGEIFWPDSTISELKLRFKNTIYRLRHAAGKDVILFEGESLYLFNRKMDYEYDVESFQKEIGLAEKARSREQQESHYQSALRHYRGSFLPDVDASWASIERERLHQMYMNALLRLATLALEARKYELSLDYCQRAIKEDSCQEDAHRLAMRVYAALGNRALVVRQYELCRQALLHEIDAYPSNQTQALYEALTQ